MTSTGLQPTDGVNARSAKEALFAARMELVLESAERHHRYLVEFVTTLTHQRHDAEDIVQELWRYVVVHFPEDKIKSVSLLRRKAYQLFVDRYRSQVRRQEVVTDSVPERPVSAGAEQHFSAAREADLKADFWGQFPGIELTEPQKEALWQHARYGYTLAELEQRLGVPASPLGDWIKLGRRRLADRLEQTEN